MGEVTENAVLAALEAVVRDHGWLIASHPSRLRATLSDVLGANADDLRGPLDALVVSAEEGVPETVREAGRHGMGIQGPILVERLETWGLAPDRAAWVVRAWVSLLPESTAPPVAVPSPAETPTPAPAPTPGSEPVRRAATLPEPTTLPERAEVDRPQPDVTVLPESQTPAVAGSTGSPEAGTGGRRRAAVLAGVGALVLALGVGVAVVALGGDDVERRKTTAVGKEAVATATASAPPASGSELVVAPDLAPGPAPGTFAMASRKAGVQIAGLADVTTFGSGTEARSRPDGGRLLAFTLADWPCAEAPCDPWTTLDLSVTVGPDQRALPVQPDPAAPGAPYVVAVPRDAGDVTLDMVADGLTQRLSLLTGDPGPDNVAVLARPDRTARIGKKFPLTETSSIALKYNDGSVHTAVDRAVTLRSATLSYFVDGKRPDSPSRAYLRIGAEYTLPYGNDCSCAFLPSEITFRDGAGTVYPAIDLDERPDKVVAVFDVPGTLRRGTILFGGSSRLTSAGVGYTTTLESRPVPVVFG